MKLEILAISKPEDQFEHSVCQYNLVMHFGTIRNWLLDELRNNPRELGQATEELEDFGEYYITLLFPDKPPSKPTEAKSK